MRAQEVDHLRGLALDIRFDDRQDHDLEEHTVNRAPEEDEFFSLLDGERLACKELRGKVVLVVNVASDCGFAAQYPGLQRLHATYQNAGFMVLGVPCNQFGGQEPGTAEEIARSCEVHRIAFPLLAKQEVNGPSRSPLYQRLVGSHVGGGRDVEWNFEKFLVDRVGRVIERFASKVLPESEELRATIERALRDGPARAPGA